MKFHHALLWMSGTDRAAISRSAKLVMQYRDTPHGRRHHTRGLFKVEWHETDGAAMHLLNNYNDWYPANETDAS